MKLDSEIFDRIRVKPDLDRQRRKRAPGCAWPGCADSGEHPAPKGRGREGQYFYFCMTHVREYNRGYNYFTGMSDDDVAVFQEQNVTGHRPTWRMAGNRATTRFSNASSGPGGHTGWQAEMNDTFGLFGPRSSYYDSTSQRTMHNAERKARGTLNLEPDADAAQIKTRYKELVKRHHPDANGGDRGSEEKLREIIQAYTYLKSAGFC